MPGMMETLLNIGLSEATLPGLVRYTGHPRLAWYAYRRLIANYGEVVAGIATEHFEADLNALRGGCDERELDFASLREIAKRHLATYAREAGEAFPQDAQVQLQQAIAAVFASWNNAKARAYRGHAPIPLTHAASASSGVVCAEIALDEAQVRARKARGAQVLMVRRDAETADIAALDLADGMLTSAVHEPCTPRSSPASWARCAWSAERDWSSTRVAAPSLSAICYCAKAISSPSTATRVRSMPERCRSSRWSPRVCWSALSNCAAQCSERPQAILLAAGRKTL